MYLFFLFVCYLFVSIDLHTKLSIFVYGPFVLLFVFPSFSFFFFLSFSFSFFFLSFHFLFHFLHLLVEHLLISVDEEGTRCMDEGLEIGTEVEDDGVNDERE